MGVGDNKAANLDVAKKVMVTNKKIYVDMQISLSIFVKLLEANIK